ncbi:MAG: ABC transporter ATP-binding protein/permease [Actinobacteria bacterium]|nr:ABC transporter ATP-binding protein/permease [Actinomycetota bacterium]
MTVNGSEQKRARPQAVRLVLRHYAEQMKIDRGLTIPAMVLPAIGDVLVWYVPPLVIAHVLGVISGDARPTLGELAPYIAAFGLTWFGGEVMWRIGGWYLNKMVAKGMARLYVASMGYLLEKDLAFFHDNFAGALTKKAIAYGRSYDMLVSTLSMDIIANLLPLVFVGFVLWHYSPLLILVLLGLVSLTIAMMMPLIKRRKALVDAREAASNTLAGHVADSISNMEAVRGFAREEFEARVHKRNVDTYAAAARKSWDYQNTRINLVTSPMYVITNVVGLMVAVSVHGHGAFSMQAVFVTFAYFSNFTRVLWQFNHIYRTFESYLAEAAQFTELLLEPPTVVDAVSPSPFEPRDASVEFRDVRFRFHDRGGEHLFDGLNLRIESGEKIGLVGHSGGGKTTVTRLLLRFMNIVDGQILIGGQDIATVGQKDLRSMIAYVPQDPVMFHRSLMDNIRFGRLDATDDEVREAARLAHAADFIDVLPEGYETLVGERGIKLSGGQRQRIAIARAILKAAPILVLDEATSSLDSDSERLIQHALWTLMEGRTAIVIAHRLSTVQQMDRLVVLESGELVEQGTHRELLAHGGVYAQLWTHQSGGFLDDEPDAADLVRAPG